MKKKNWRQEHFIQTIKGGLVLKVMNIDSHGHGQPTLKFKSLKAICDSESTQKLSITSNVEEQEGLITSEPRGNRKSSDLNDENLGSLTLKQIKEMSKTKKRKLSQSDKTYSHGCISSSEIDLTVEVNVEAAYEEKTSILKMKLMSMKKTIATAPSTSVKSPVSFDESVVQGMYDQSIFQTVVDEHGPFNAVIEAKERDHLNCQDVVHVSDCSAPGSYAYMGYSAECYDEMLEKANRNMLVIKESLPSFCKEISRCPSSDIPKKYLEPAGSSFSVYTADNFGESPNAYLSEEHKSLPSFVCENHEEASLTRSDPNRSPCEENLVTDELHFEKNTSIQQETLCSNQVGYTVTQMLNMALNSSLQEPGLLYGGDASGPDKSGEDDKVYICDLNPDVVSEQLEEASTIGTVLYYSNNDEISSTNELGSDKNASFQQGKSACHMDCDSVTKMPDTLNNSLLCTELCYGIDEIVPDSDDEGDNEDAKSDLKLNVAESISSTYIPDISTTDTPQPMELSDGGSGCDFSVGNDGDTEKDISPELAATLTNIGDSVSSHDSYPSLSPSNVSDLRVNGPLTDEGKQSLTSNLSLFASDVKATLQGSSLAHSSDATNAIKYVETLEGCLREDKEICPKRLLSTRMVISPTSQEKLCRGLNAGALCDNVETFNCREKLFVEDQSERKNSLGVKTIPRQNMKKQKKNSKTGFSQLVPKGSLNAPSFSHHKPCTSKKIASESTSAQKVIAFSQRQMLDSQNLALDLMKQLKVMNAIVKETLLSEVGQPTSSKHSADEIQGALQDAARVEQKTKRWLSIMTKDCIRFCKIMETTETKPSLPVHKKKKIRFADEDGGTLCHVYEDPQHVT